MTPVVIHTTPQSYRIKVTPMGHIAGTTLSITHHAERFTEYVWDPYINRKIPKQKYRYYHKERGDLHFPAYDLPRFLTLLSEHGVPYELRPLELCPGAPVDIPMQPWFKPKDERQGRSIDHLCSSTDAHLLGLALQPGGGKTATSIRTASHYGVRTMICVGGLTDQWVRAIKQFTLCGDADIYVIQGNASIAKLLSQINRTLFPKFIVASLGTLRNYCLDADAYINFPPFDEFCHRLGVGLRITDEVHLNFHLNMMLDLRLRMARTIVLTATFSNSKPDVKKIFDAHYPPAIRFGEDDYDIYVDVFAYAFCTGYGDIPAKVYKAKDGYSHAMYEGFLLKKKNAYKLEQIVNQVYLPIIYAHYINIKRDGQKMLILCSTVAMCEYVRDLLRFHFPKLRSEIYIGETDDSVLDEADFIVSTLGSAGTGRDIKNLRTVFVTVSEKSDPRNRQVLGRLRKLASGDTPQFVFCYNRSVPQQVSHAAVRRDIFEPLALHYHSLEL